MALAMLHLKPTPEKECRISDFAVPWEQKVPRIRPAELDEAKAAYDRARYTYDCILVESPA